MSALLALERVSAGYGATTVLDDLSFRLEAGEICAILGRNGVGKTTLLRTIMGHTRLHRGTLHLAGRDASTLPPYRRARAGVGFVPQEREVFPSLSVAENLAVAARRGGAWTMERAFLLFPRLAERRRSMADRLSGGEQQMLSIARALMGDPRLLLLDEPMEGLAPVIVDSVLDALASLRAGGIAMLLVEQHARRALDFAPRTLVMDRGRIVHDGPSAQLRDDSERLAALLGVRGPEHISSRDGGAGDLRRAEAESGADDRDQRHIPEGS
ncbi:MAG TPA: ABC transporter ATP-binding protein [Stellaceae bacterium]|nr:ABC transporter ATP-binding protein [Stellaceae bacterium]